MASSGTIGKINAGGNDYLVASTAFATCSTAASTAAKVATIQDSASFTAIEGITVQVLFTYSNTAENPTLNINSTGAYPIYLNTGVVPGLFAASSWSAGSIVSFTLHNNFWYMNDVKEDIFIIHVSDYDGQVTVQESSDELTNAVSRGAIPFIVWSDADTTMAMIAQPQNLIMIRAFVAVNYAGLIDTNTLNARSNGFLGVYVVYWAGSQIPPTGISFQYPIENRNNKVSSISSGSTSTEYPSAQAVYNYVTANFAAISHTHGNITNGGDITTNVAIASGDRLVINDESESKINNSSITFGTSTTQFLANNGTWQTPAGGVSDVTVNGTSVVSSGVASITGDLTDTKNTAGSTDTSSKIYLIGATSQAANPQTYSDNQVYATNGQLDANKVRIAEHATLQYNSTDQAIEFVFA